MKTRKQLGRFILGICMILLIAACAPLEMSTEELTERIQESMDSRVNVHLIQEMHFTQPDGTKSTEEGAITMIVQETWTRDNEHSRHETRTENYPEHDRISIQNGDQIFSYTPLNNSYITMDMTGLGADGNVEAERPSAAKMIADTIEHFDIAYLGAEKIAGRMTYKVAASPKEDTSGGSMMSGAGTITMWVDQETFYPLQTEHESGVGTTFTTKTTFVEFGVEMPEELFMPPTDAIEVEYSRNVPQQMTLEEVQDKVDFDLLSLPESSGFEFETAMAMSAEDFAGRAPNSDGEAPSMGEGFDVTQLYLYNDGEKFLRLNQSSMAQPEMPEGMPRPEAVAVRGQEGETITASGGSNLSWTENGIRFNMGGHGLSIEKLLELAESLE